MTRVQVTIDHTRRSDPSPVALPASIPHLAVTAEGTVAANQIAKRRTVWTWVHGWGGAPLERWLRHRP